MSVSRNVATVLLERVFDNYLWELADDAQQIVGPERGEGGSQLDSMISKVNLIAAPGQLRRSMLLRFPFIIFHCPFSICHLSSDHLR